MKVLQFCNEDRATSWQRFEAFKNMGVDVKVLYHSLLNTRYTLPQKIMRAILHRLEIPLERNNENTNLINEVLKNEYDILFIEKCLTLRPETLIHIKKVKPKIKLICYTLDDFMTFGNRSRFFFKCIPLYDLIATNKEHNINEYYSFNASKVYYFKNAYSRLVHRPIEVGADKDLSYYIADVCFIGTFEKIRAEYLRYLAENGIRIKIWGWGKSSNLSGIEHANITNMNTHVYFDDFAKVVCSSKICLNFLRRNNRDTETTRSIEIPACSGFMLAERTENHLALFKEGEEAEYFSNKNEVLSKVNFYLKNDFARKQIAVAGFNRCKTSDYSYENQLKGVLSKLD